MAVNEMGYGARVGLEGLRHKSGAFPRQMVFVLYRVS